MFKLIINKIKIVISVFCIVFFFNLKLIYILDYNKMHSNNNSTRNLIFFVVVFLFFKYLTL